MTGLECRQERVRDKIVNMTSKQKILVVFLALATEACASWSPSFHQRNKTPALPQSEMYSYPDFSMSIALSDNPLPNSTNSLHTLQHIDWHNITDCPARFIADPFLFYHHNTWYIFIEVLNAETAQGDIGMLSSLDGKSWQYDGIVLNEPFHLSYPFVFEDNDHIYMIPEAAHGKGVFLYEASEFPRKWIRRKTLVNRALRDPTLFHHNNQWWMFASVEKNRELQLFIADHPEGPWTEHPQSPVIQDNANIARCGGRVSPACGSLYRIAQDCEPNYGNQIRAFLIESLTSKTFKETELSTSPILSAGDFPWATDGMHHLSSEPFGIGTNQWLIAFDGYKQSSPDIPTTIRFSGNQTLLGVSIRPAVLHPGDACMMRCFWNRPPSTDAAQHLIEFIHFQQHQHIFFQADHEIPINQCMIEKTFRIPEDAPSGKYQVLTGLYYPENKQRIKLEHSRETEVVLPVEVHLEAKK